MEEEVANYRKQMLARFENELQLRNKFNTTTVRYLPPAFHPLLAMNPVKYEIFPTQNISPLAGLSSDDLELFGMMKLASSPLEPEDRPIMKQRKTTI